MRYLRQSTQQTVVLGPLSSNVDYVYSPSTVLYNATGIDVDIYKGGTRSDVTLSGTPAADGYFVHEANGYHSLILSTSHTDTVGRLKVTFNATGILPFAADFTVLPAVVYDAIIAGTDNLDVNVYQWLGAGAPANTGDAYAVVSNGTYGNQAIETLVDDLESRLTATRAGYLDSLANLPSDPADQSAVEAAITSATSGLATASALSTLQATASNILRWFTNKRTASATAQVLYADDSVTPLYTQTVTDDGSTATRGKAS